MKASSSRSGAALIALLTVFSTLCKAEFEVTVPEDPTASVGDGVELTCVADGFEIDEIDSCEWISPDGEQYDDRGRDRDFEVSLEKNGR